MKWFAAGLAFGFAASEIDRRTGASYGFWTFIAFAVISGAIVWWRS